jgi:hypothetical protein
MTLRNIILERREKTRKVPDEFAFLQLEQDDGGKVLDISEGGLRFESFAPVQEEPNAIHFWFSLNLRERIEGWGELAWTAAGGKSGGLKFLRLADRGREQIREYLRRSSPEKISPKAGAHELDAVATFVSRARPRPSTLFPAKPEPGKVSIPFPVTAGAPTSGVLVPMERHLAAVRRQLIIGLLIGAGVAGIVSFSAIKLTQYVRGPRSIVNPAVEAPAQAEPAGGSSLAVHPAASTASPDVFAISSQKKAGVAVRAPAAPAAEAGIQTRRPKTPLTPDQLWTMVQAGNSTAAAALAELYIKGEGVPQNCAQARVLLLVASEKRNAGAIKRLADLDKGGCPAN